MRKEEIIIEKWLRRLIEKKEDERRKREVNIIRKLIEGLIKRKGVVKEMKREFVGLEKDKYMKRIYKNINKKLMDR